MKFTEPAIHRMRELLSLSRSLCNLLLNQPLLPNYGDRSNFVITGLPRSGTSFLASIMNRSIEYSVAHDRDVWLFYKMRNNPRREAFYRKLINRRLARRNYGEICGGLRFQFDEWEVEKKGVILRHPVKVFLSTANMNGVDSISERDFRKDCEHIDNLAERYYTIEFHRMTSDTDYLGNVLKFFGIRDVTVTTQDLHQKVNARPYRYKTPEDFPKHLKLRLQDETDWFVKKYALPFV